LPIWTTGTRRSVLPSFYHSSDFKRLAFVVDQFACLASHRLRCQHTCELSGTEPLLSRGSRVDRCTIQPSLTPFTLPLTCQCHGGVNGSFHDARGWPVFDPTRFTSVDAMTAKAHDIGLKPGFYVNNYICGEGMPPGGTTGEAYMTVMKGVCLFRSMFGLVQPTYVVLVVG
jgi:hypothetical protein